MALESVKLSSKSIAKNTIYLYVRMMFIMLITLYTSRIVLKELGIVDFGIYNLVAGFVVMFSFFGSSLSNAAQRFLNYEYGLGNIKKVEKIFNMGFFIFFIMSVVVVLLLETFGVWFLNNKLVIPIDRIEQANIVFHYSVASVFITVNSYIYRAILIARENMKIYTYTGIFEAIGRLIIAYLLIRTTSGKMVLYSILYACISITVCIVYMIYCHTNYKECKFSFSWEKNLFKKMLSFIGWNAFTSLTEAVNQQGISVILNMFFGPVVNAARGISFQINNALLSFSHNIYMAARPQLVKAYAMGDMIFFLKTINTSSKLTYYLLLIISMPLIVNMNFILDLWLDKVPSHTYVFSISIVIYTLIDSLKNPLWAAVQSVGDLKKYSMEGGIIFLLNFPISYVLLKFGFDAKWVYITYILVRIIYLFRITQIIDELIFDFDLRNYLQTVILPITKVTIIASVLPLCTTLALKDDSLMFFVKISVSFVSCLFVIYLIGLDLNERIFIQKFIKNKIKRAK